MKILFIGTVDFSERSLQKLIGLDAEIVGVCGKKKAKFNSDFVDLKLLSENHKIPFKYVDDINSDNSQRWIKSLNPDIVFCFAVRWCWRINTRYSFIRQCS